jgi:hypothetical protein
MVIVLANKKPVVKGLETMWRLEIKHQWRTGEKVKAISIVNLSWHGGFG